MTRTQAQTLCYGRPDQVFDYYRPDTPAALPLLVCIHGGGWISGDRTMYADEAAWASQQGVAVACPSYRLAPLHPFPAAVADIQAFMRHARRDSAGLGIDPGHIVVMGNSAGGHLAAMAGLCTKALDDNEPAELADAVVSLSGISDLQDPDAKSAPIARSFLEEFMGSTYNDDPARFAAASPITYVDSHAPPFLIVHGAADEIVPVQQSRDLVDALRKADRPVSYLELPGEGHSYSLPAWERIRFAYMEFVRGL